MKLNKEMSEINNNEICYNISWRFPIAVYYIERSNFGFNFTVYKYFMV